VRLKLTFALCLVALLSASPACTSVSGTDGEDTLTSSDVGVVDAEVEADTATDPCEGLVNGASCDDGDPCTLEDECSAGVCVGGSNDPCTSDNPCQTGTCVAGEGCAYEEAEDGQNCAVTCFGEATCQAGVCVANVNTKAECPSPGPETPCVSALACDINTGECTVEVQAIAGASCDTDGDLCSLEACDSEGECTSKQTVNDCAIEKKNKPCQLWQCDNKSGQCSEVGFAGEISCDDGNACTKNDVCSKDDFNIVGCLGSPVPVDDGNDCTDDSCVDGTVLHNPINGQPCETGNACAPLGLCEEGACVGGDQDCGCINNAECPQPEDACLGVAICDQSGAQGECKIQDGSPITCPPESSCIDGECVPDCDPNLPECADNLPKGTTVYDQGEDIIKGIVPPNTTQMEVALWGGGGGGGGPGAGGGGAYVVATVAVKAGDSVELRVGGAGGFAGGGGGATYVFLNDQFVMVAGGGGGGGSDGCSGCHAPGAGAGGGGGAVGQKAEDGVEDNEYNAMMGGGGGATADQGGSAGVVNNQSIYDGCTHSGTAGEAHKGGQDGKGGNCTYSNDPAIFHEGGGGGGGGNGHGGGGGSGYFGGGSGAAMYTYNGGGGGGGSSWVDTLTVSLMATEGGSTQETGGKAHPLYKGTAGRGGNGKTDPFDPDQQGGPGSDGLIVLTL
jgi:hypothetical protein